MHRHSTTLRNTCTADSPFGTFLLLLLFKYVCILGNINLSALARPTCIAAGGEAPLIASYPTVFILNPCFVLPTAAVWAYNVHFVHFVAGVKAR